MSDTEAPAREKGSQEPTTPCGTCGASLKLVTYADGGVGSSTCSTCFPATEKAASAPVPTPRERGTTTTESE